MALEEKISRHLGIPFVEIEHEGEKKYLCSNGVLFTDREYLDYADLNAEYERREKEDMLYDYSYAKSTGLLRKKRGYKKTEEVSESYEEDELPVKEESKTSNNYKSLSSGSTEERSSRVTESWSNKQSYTNRWNGNNSNRREEKQGFSTLFIITLLGFTSLISGYISTLHTATYLYDYVDTFSAWLMSASVTAYNATAFEVSVIFKSKKRYGLTFVFIVLWGMVTLFSMATTVSVFYDRFNFNETQTAEENKQFDSNKLALELLRTKEKDLRESINFKKKDIEYRQARDYATTAVRLELESLQKELQENISEQQKVLSETPEVTEKVTKRKESLFAFLGRLLSIEGGVMEFTMSTLSAIFVNIVCPFSLVAVGELKKKKELTK